MHEAKYLESMGNTIIACAREGGSVVARCVAIGISRKTYYQWISPDHKQYHEAFHEAHEQAEELCQEWWENQGIDGLWTDPKTQRFDSRVWQLNMMNRFGWGLKNENDNKNENIEILIAGAKFEPEKLTAIDTPYEELTDGNNEADEEASPIQRLL